MNYCVGWNILKYFGSKMRIIFGFGDEWELFGDNWVIFGCRNSLTLPHCVLSRWIWLGSRQTAQGTQYDYLLCGLPTTISFEFIHVFIFIYFYCNNKRFHLLQLCDVRFSLGFILLKYTSHESSYINLICSFLFEYQQFLSIIFPFWHSINYFIPTDTFPAVQWAECWWK